MENNNDFSYLLPPVIEDQKRQVDTIAKDIRYKSTPLAQQQTDSLYSVASLNNMNVDKRMNAVDYSTKFSDVYETLSDGTPVAKFETYLPGTNNEERLAQQQSTTEKWGNGLAKLALKTGTAVVGGTVGIVDSLITGISQGSLNEAYNSGVNVWLDDLNTKLDYKLPNYYTEQDRNASFTGQLGQANFYADKLLGGLSFMTGAIISEAIWTAATAATFGAAEVGLATNTARIARGLEKWSLKGAGETGIKKILNAAKATAKTPSTATLEATALEMRAISSFEKAGSRLGYSIGKGLDIVVPIARSAGYESGMEARLYEKQTEAKWLEKYENENGYAPSSEEYADFKSKLANSANGVFAANMAILSVSNYTQFGNAILGRTTARTIENNAFRRMAFGQGFDRVIDAEGKSVLRAIEATKGQKIFGKVYGLGKNFVTESQEEMGQSVVTGTAENYIMAGYDRDKIKTSYGLMDAFHEGLEKTYTSKEGWTEGLIGGLIGVMGGVGGGVMNVRRGKSFYDITNERETLQNTIDYSNGITADMHLSNVIANNRMQYAQELKEQAKIKNDIPGEVLANTTSGVARIERDIAIGGLEEGLKDYNRQVNALSPEYLMEELGFETKESVDAYKEHLIAEHKALADSYSENLAYAESLVGSKDFAGSKDLGANILEIQRGIAMNLTMGEKSRKIHSDITGVLNDEIVSLSNVEGVTDGLNVQQILDLAPKEKVQNLQRLGREKKNLENRRKTQQNSITKAGKVVEGEEASTRTNRLLELTNEIAETEQAIATNEEQRQIALNGIGIEQYTEGTITADMIDAQGANVEKFSSFMKDLAQKSPQKYDKIIKLLEQQSKSIQHIKNYEESVQAVTNKTTRLKTINGWVSSLLNRNEKLKDGQRAYFVNVLESYNKQTIGVKQESEELKNRRLFEEGKEVDPKYIKSLETANWELHPIDQQILDQSRGEGVATIKVPTNESRIKQLERERDVKISEIENIKTAEKVGVSSVFEQNKELTSIGTQEQYSEYITTIFPNSKVQDIVYHGTMSKSFEKFNTDVVFFTNDKNYAKNLNIGVKQFGRVLPALININKALKTEQEISYVDENNKTLVYVDPRDIKKEGIYDAIIGKDQGQTQGITYVTFDNSQVHLLGTRSDIKGFKNFVENDGKKTNIEKIRVEYAKRIKELQPTSEAITPIDILKEKVQQITSHPYYAQYFGESFNEKNRNKPKESDAKEYEWLLAKIDRKVESKLSRILERPSNYKYKGDLGLTVQEINRLKELNQVLGDWQTFQGTSAGNNESVADLLERINALEVKASTEEVVTSLNEESYKVVVSESEEEVAKKSSDNRGLSTPVQALRTRMPNNTYRWSHITKEKFATFFNGVEGILQDDKKKGFAVILQNGKTINTTYNNRGGFDMTIQEWESAEEDSNILVKNFGNNSTAINQSIGLDSQGNEQFEILYGDAGYLQTTGENLEINEDEVNKVKNNDVLDLVVLSTDAFNAETKMLSKEEQKERERYYHIYVYKNGNLIASLPANYSEEGIEGVGLPLKDLRQNAKNFAEKQIKEGKTGLIRLPYKVEANLVFIGQPNLTLQNDEAGNTTTKQNNFTPESIQLVRGQGYIQDGVVTSSTNVDVKQFITKLSKSKENEGKKVPFIIFDYNGKNVAFPVDLIQMSNPQGDSTFDLMKNKPSNNDKIKILIEALNTNGINPNQFGINYSDSENFTEQTDSINKAIDALNEVKEVVDIKKFAKKEYKADRLIKDATIAIKIDKTPFLTSKIMMKLSNKIDSDVLGYKEQLEEAEKQEKEATFTLSVIALKLAADIKDNPQFYTDSKGDQIEDNYNEVMASDFDIPKDLDFTNTDKNYSLHERARNFLIKAVTEKNLSGTIFTLNPTFRKRIGKEKISEIKTAIESFNKAKSLQKSTKAEIKKQIAEDDRLEGIDTTFVTVDENGELENPYINETKAIQELGGVKTQEEFEEKLENSDLDYLKTAETKLFEDMSQFNNIPIKEVINGDLVDKLNTEVKDNLVATIREPENSALTVSLSNLEGYSANTWNSLPEAVKTLLREVEKQSLEINVDLRGLSEEYYTKTQEEILNIIRALDFMISNPTEASMEHFIEVYQDFRNIIQEAQRAVVKVDERYRELPLIKLETTDLEYKTFKEQGLLKVQDGVYIKTDGNEKSLAEVESLSATNVEVFPAGTIQGDIKNTELVKEDLNTFVESQMADVQTNDAEYDVDTVKKLIYYKTYFGTGTKTTEKNYEAKLSQIAISDIKNIDYLTSDFISKIRNKQLKDENVVLDNLVFNDKGITLRYTDLISTNEMNEYLKEDEDLRNYFLLNKNTNFEVTGVAQDEIVSERDKYVNGATKENYKDSYRTINSETIQTKSSEDFITVDGINYERIESDFYVKLPSNKTNFLEINVEKSTLNIDTGDYNSVQADAEIKISNKYSAEESKKLDSELGCN